MKKIHLISVFIFIFCTLQIFTNSVTAKVYVDIDSPTFQQIPIAICDFGNQITSATKSANFGITVSDDVKKYLSLTGMFNIVNKKSFLENNYIGCSNFAGWQVMKALAISDKHDWERFVAFQGLYSILVRDLEYELAPLCVDQGLGILTWSPLAGGFLSGKYRRGQPRPQGARLSEGTFMFDEQKAYDIVDELDSVATAHSGTITQASLNYLLCKPGVSSVVVGIRTPEQLADNLKTTDWEMQAEEVSKLDKLSKPAPIYPHDFLAHFPLD